MSNSKVQSSNESLTNVSLVKRILAQQELRPQKRLGQHFLVDRRILERLLAAAEISSTDTLVEVGAGIGTITIELAKKAKEVYAVEIDKNLIPALEININDFINAAPCTVTTKVGTGTRVNVVSADILNFNPAAYTLRPGDYKVIGAIPYQITSPLLHHLIIQENPPSLIVIIIQKEVAEKICAKPPAATYLSNFIGTFAKTEIVGRPIPPSAFWPQPDVYSAILKINFSPKLDSSIARSLEYSEFLHRGFSHPRKMLNKVFDEKLLTAAGIVTTRRAQTLTQEEWFELFSAARSNSKL